MTNAEVRYKFMKHFIDTEFSGYGCHADDFLSDENKVVLSRESDEDFYSMICFKNSVIVKSKKDIYEWSKKFVSKHVGFRCFDLMQASVLSRELLKYNLLLNGGQGFLPDMTIKRSNPETEFSIRIFDHSEMMKIYDYIDKDEWHMCKPSEDTELAVAAFDGDKIIGLSSADSDSVKLWSIDAEVLPQYRDKGIAASLTMEITNTLLDKGVIPFATGAWSNTASKTTLYKCGYYPAWSSMGSTGNERAMKILYDTDE